MSTRLFAERQERYGSQWRTVARIQCRKCGCSESIGIGTLSGLMPPNVISKKFEQKGWTVGANEQWDYCKGCSNSMKGKKQQMNNVLKPQIFSAATLATPPREMDREDRRIIFAKLNEVYLDGKRGYDSGWSDHRVSTELGVPRKWVETLRVENFGDAGTNAEMSEFHEQALKIFEDAKKVLKEAKEHHEKARALMETAPNQKTLAEISDRLGKIERLAETVRKYVVAA